MINPIGAGGRVASPRCRIGLVGAGRVATRHASTLAGFRDAELVAVTDPDVDAAARLAGSVGADVAADLETLLGLRLDAVYICVPPFAHGPTEDAVLEAGLPFLVEPPLGLDAELPERIAARVAAAGVVTAVGHHWRYSTAFRRVADSLAGRPCRLVNAAWLEAPPPAGWQTRRERSGGQIVERAVHLLDLTRVLAGEVEEVYAVTDTDVDGTEATSATLRFASGAVGTLAATNRLDSPRRIGLEAYVEGASALIAEDRCGIRFGERSEWHAVDPALARDAVDRAFLDAVRRPENRSGVLVDYAQAMGSHQLAVALALSATTGRPIRPAISVR
jgi:myo-inositol 2-dehydrogenase/D-chiro-inositol 1-dehydrogenase